MEWYWWLVIGLAAIVVLGLATWRIVRATRRGRRFLRLSSRGKLRFARLLLADRQVPLVARGILLLAIGYLVLPLDLVPDFIPVVGHLDDGIVVAAVVALLMLAVPKARFDAALDSAEREGAVPAHQPPPSAAGLVRETAMKMQHGARRR